MTAASNLQVEKLIRENFEPDEIVTEGDLPLLPVSWHIIVQPLTPKKQTSGGIFIAEKAQEVEQIQITIGRLVSIGALAFKGRAASGLCMADDPRLAALKPGDYVLWARYTGQIIKLQPKKLGGKDRMVIQMTDTELMSVVTDPDQIRFWI